MDTKMKALLVLVITIILVSFCSGAFCSNVDVGLMVYDKQGYGVNEIKQLSYKADYGITSASLSPDGKFVVVEI